MCTLIRFSSKLRIMAIGLLIVLAWVTSAQTAMAAPITRSSAVESTLSDPNCVQPPANVDHATFTNAQLDLYGLPHRTKDEPLAWWQQAVRSAKHRVCTGVATKVSTVGGTHTISPYTYNEGWDNWAGNIANDSGYSDAHGMWNVPCLTLLLNNATAIEWAGLGGDSDDGGGDLIQSGTVAQEYSPVSGYWTAQYYAWIEDVPWNPDVIFKFNVSCGDTMLADDYQDYSGGKPTSANMYIEDETSGQYSLSTNTHDFSNGSSAEWILERGTNWGSPEWLANFHSVTFTDCLAERNGIQANPINLPHNYSVMWWNGHYITSVGGLYPDGSDPGANFQVAWLASH